MEEVQRVYIEGNDRKMVKALLDRLAQERQDHAVEEGKLRDRLKTMEREIEARDLKEHQLKQIGGSMPFRKLCELQQSVDAIYLSGKSKGIKDIYEQLNVSINELK